MLTAYKPGSYVVVVVVVVAIVICCSLLFLCAWPACERQWSQQQLSAAWFQSIRHIMHLECVLLLHQCYLCVLLCLSALVRCPGRCSDEESTRLAETRLARNSLSYLNIA